MISVASRINVHRVLYLFSLITLFGFASSNAYAMADFALGGHNICSIDTDGRLECTTRFNARTYLAPDDDTRYTQVVSGGAHTCAITQAGEIRCWGLNSFGQSDDIPTSSVAFTALSAGENHTCALDANGQVYCWGLNTNNQLNVPADNQGFVSIHTGALGSCGIRASGFAECWSTDSAYTIQRISANTWTDFVFPTEGNFSPACGLTNDGLIDCWSTNLSLPKPDNGPYTQIESSGSFFCGLKADGYLDCSVYQFNGSANSESLQVLEEIEALPPLVDFEVRSSGPSLHGLCGIDFDGKLHCVGNRLPADNLPGDSIDVPVPFGLSFSVYSDIAGELFWQSDVSSISTPIVGYKVYRNGELVRFDEASASYFDEDIQPDMTYEYEVSIVLLDGSEGQRSEALTVTTGDVQEPPGNPDPGNMSDYALTGIKLDRYSALTLELFWNRPSGDETISRYDVFRNGEFLKSTPGPSFFDNTVQSCDTYQYTIAAVSTKGHIVALGFQSEGTFPGTTCP